jgi:hypothetical protein
MIKISIETYYDNLNAIKPIEAINTELHQEESNYNQQDDLFREQLNQELLIYRQAKAAQKYQEAQLYGRY